MASADSSTKTTRTCPTCGNPYPAYVSRCPDDGTLLRNRDTEIPDQEPNTIAGTTIDGRYYVGSLIGKGAMGRVYRGNQLSVGRPVAIKVLRKKLSNNLEVRERFLREARLISGFTHPNIVRLVDFGEFNDRLYIVMEYIDGVPLQRLIRGRPTKLELALDVAIEICGPLIEAHEAGVTHRDLKPDNIFLGRSADGGLQVKILDFGIARVDRKGKGVDLTREGMVFGTPEYMSPEQARGKSVTPATDLYAVGILLYEMLTGELPILGLSPTETMIMQIRDDPKDIRELVPELPGPLSDLVTRLLQKDPAKRPESARALKSVLEELRKTLNLSPVAGLPDEDDFGFILEKRFVKARISNIAPLSEVPQPTPLRTEEASRGGDTRMNEESPAKAAGGMTSAILFALGSFAILVSAIIIAVVFG